MVEVDNDSPANNFDTYVATVGWHTEHINGDIHEVRIMRFWDDDEAKDYYNDVSTLYAKKLFSKKNGTTQYSEGWAKFIPIDKSYTNYWVSYISSKQDSVEEGYFINLIKYFTDKKSAESYYDSLKNESKKFSGLKEGVISELGYDAPNLV